MAIPTSFAQNSDKKFAAPWHGFANPINDETGKDIEAALQAGDLAWSPVKHALIDPFTGQASPVYGIYRDDTHAFLGHAKERYEPISARQAFEFLSDIIGKAGFTIDSVGHMDNGAVMFANVRTEDIEIVKGDNHAVYWQFLTSNDGTVSLQVLQSMVRMVCSNTIAAAMRTASAALKVKHTMKALQRMENIKLFLAAAQKENEAFADKLRFLATVKTNADFQREFMKRFFQLDSKEKALRDTTTKKIEAIEAAEGVDGITGIRGTAYELLQKVTNAFDHNTVMAGVRGKDLTEADRAVKRLESVAFGQIATQKTQAFELLLDMSK